MKIDVDIVINKRYIRYLQDDTRYQLFYGGSSSGKSFFLAQRTVIDILQGKRNYLVVRQVQNTIKKSVFNEITKAINAMNLSKLFSINRTDLIITCNPNNKQILFSGLDDSEKIKSITPIDGVITDIWIEEATETYLEDIKQLDKRLRGISGAKKRMTLSFNPILQSHWIYKEYFGNWDDRKKVYRDERLIIVKSIYKDNDFLAADDIYALENETDKYYYEVYTKGNWGILGAVIFKNWSVEDLTDIKKTADKIKNGLDFGFAKDPCALVHTYYDKTRKTIYVLDEMYMTELTNDVLAKELKKRINNQYVVCDCAEPKSIRELKNYEINAIPAKKGKDSISFGIQWLQQQKIVIDTKCINTRNEFQQYKWKEDKNGNVLPVPVDKNNHCLVGSTVVNTVTGDHRIADLVGTEGHLYCYDEINKRPSIGNFYNVRKTQTEVDVYQIILSDRRSIIATKNHPILTQDGWEIVENLSIFDEIIQIQFTSIETLKIKIISIDYLGKHDVYNMEVEDHHNFAVNGGLIVHNCIDALRYAYEDEFVQLREPVNIRALI